jgi:hypothetical protein
VVRVLLELLLLLVAWSRIKLVDLPRSLYQDIRILQQIFRYLSDIWGKNIGYFQP